MSRVEASLGNIFRAMREKKNQSKKTSSALDFKLRCVDLLENFVHCVARMSSMEELPFDSRQPGDNRSVVFVVLPLLVAKIKQSQHSGALKPLHDKLRRVVMKEICAVHSYPSLAGHGRLLLKSLRSLLVFASSGNPTQEFAALLERAVALLAKVRLLMNVFVLFRRKKRFCCATI